MGHRGGARAGRQALAPLERAAARRLAEWVPKLTRPVRVGEHAQTAFAFGLVLDWARGEATRRWRAGRDPRPRVLSRRRACPLAYEPSGEDFLSPCLAEADLMRRVLPPAEFAAWLARFLPGLPRRRGAAGSRRPWSPTRPIRSWRISTA